MVEPPRPRTRGEGCSYVGAIVVAACGVLGLPVWALLGVLGSDVCSPDSTASFCHASGQTTVMTIGFLAGPGAFAVGLVSAIVSRRARRVWPYVVVLVQFFSAIAISVISSDVY